MTAQHKQTFMTDIEAIETDNTCSMKYWYKTFEGGRGITHKDEVIPEALQEAMHADLRAISEMDDLSDAAIQAAIDDILKGLTFSDKQDVKKMELLYRRLGHFAGFAMFIEPRIRMLYDTIPFDSEIILDRDPMWVVAHPDRLLKSKSSNEIVYREYVFMPASMWSRKWLESWRFNMRLHLGLAAAQPIVDEMDGMHGQEISYGQVMGIGEGYRGLTDDRLVHPYVWGYFDKKNRVWTPHIKDGWDLMPVWNYPLGIVNWVRMCGQQIADNQFQLSTQVTLRDDLVDSFLSARLKREREIGVFADSAQTNIYIRNVHFARNTSQCRPMNGPICPYAACCLEQDRSKKPLDGGGYVQRNIQIEQKVGEIVA